MNSIVRTWRTWKHGRKFSKKGKHCRFPGKNLEVRGHVELGDDVRIRDNVILRTSGNGKIVFGNRCGCSWYCIIEATQLVQIGDFTGLAEFVVIHDSHHTVYGTKEHWRMTPLHAGPVIIGRNCLIGSRTYIGPGITIEDGAIIVPNSVITKNVGAYEIWSGNPARRIAHRTEDLPTSILKRNKELLDKYGVKECRHGYNPRVNDSEEENGQSEGAS